MTAKHGCHNTERKPFYFAPHRYYHEGGTFETLLVHIEDRSSTECKYDRRSDDSKCKGCTK